MNYQQFIIRTHLTSDAHPYLVREMQKPLHPVMVALLNAGVIDVDIIGLGLEWPHVSKDGKRVAYTQDPARGEADRQSVTDLSDYLRRYI